MKTGPCSTTSTPSPGGPRTARYCRLRKRPSEASIEPAGLTLFCRERLHRLRKNSTLHLILGGAALQRCGDPSRLIAALAAEAGLAQCYLYVGSESPTPPFMDVLNRLFEQHFHSPVERAQPLQGELGGSGRKIIRLSSENLSAIGVLYDVREENVAF